MFILIPPSVYIFTFCVRSGTKRKGRLTAWVCKMNLRKLIVFERNRQNPCFFRVACILSIPQFIWIPSNANDGFLMGELYHICGEKYRIIYPLDPAPGLPIVRRPYDEGNR